MGRKKMTDVALLKDPELNALLSESKSLKNNLVQTQTAVNNWRIESIENKAVLEMVSDGKEHRSYYKQHKNLWVLTSKDEIIKEKSENNERLTENVKKYLPLAQKFQADYEKNEAMVQKRLNELK